MNKKINNQGQVLLIVVVSLAVLLGVGLSISSNTISSTLRTSRTDSFQKVTAAAEGGIEKSLALSDNVLGAKIAEGQEVIEYSASNTKATVVVSDYSAGSSGIVFETLQPGEVGTFYFIDTSNGFDPASADNLQNVCLKISSSDASPSYMLNVIVRNPAPAAFTPYTAPVVPAVSPLDSTLSNNFNMRKYLFTNGNFTSQNVPPTCSSGGVSGFRYDKPILLRIHPINQTLNNLKVELVGSEGGNSVAQNVRQGFKITSKGEFLSGGDGSTRVIEAVKYLDAPSNIFDYAAFIDYE